MDCPWNFPGKNSGVACHSFSSRYCEWRVKMVTVAHTSLVHPKSIFKWSCKQAEKTITENTRNKGAMSSCDARIVSVCHFHHCPWILSVTDSPSFLFLLSITTYMNKPICTFHYITNSITSLQKIWEQREIALVHGTFVERQVEWISLKVFTLHFTWSIS